MQRRTTHHASLSFTLTDNPADGSILSPLPSRIYYLYSLRSPLLYILSPVSSLFSLLSSLSLVIRLSLIYHQLVTDLQLAYHSCSTSLCGADYCDDPLRMRSSPTIHTVHKLCLSFPLTYHKRSTTSIINISFGRRPLACH